MEMSALHAYAMIYALDRDECRLRRDLAEAMEEIDALNKENDELTVRLKELEARHLQQHRMKFKRNSSPAAPAAGNAPGGKPRKRGAPSGHPPWTRPAPDHIDRTVKIPPPYVCPHCASEGLTPSGNEHVQLQEDIVLQPRTVVTEYVHQTAWCPGCRREVFATADGELRNCGIGPVAQAAAVYMRHEVKLSYRDVCKVFDGLFGMPFVPASAMAFSHRTAGQAAHLYEDIRNKVQAFKVAHGDETHWRIAGKSAYLWYDGDNLFTFLEVPGMPPTNNHAEQSLRLPVIFRKITFGSQSLHGAQALAVNLSLAATAKR